MNYDNKRLYLLENEKISKALIKLGLPTMIGMLVSALYNVVDAYCVGKLGTAQIGAVSIVFPLGVIITGVALLFGSGASSYLARLLGNKEYKKANICASTSLFSSMIIGTIIIFSMLFFINPILRNLGATDTIFPFAKQYGTIFIIGLIFNVFNVTVNNMIIAEGASKFSMITMLIGGVLNIILDVISIYVLKMGINGVAIATLISRIISASLYLIYILSGKSIFKFSIKNIKMSKKLYMEICKIGIPVMVFQILTSIALGKGKIGGIISLCRQGIFFIPFVLVMPIFFKLNGLIIAQPLADIASIVLVFILKSKENLRIKKSPI